MAAELDYEQTIDFLWKLMCQNERIWEMSDNEVCRKYATVFAVFDTLNCVNVPNCFKFDSIAFVTWTQRVMVQEMIRALYREARNEKLCRLAICGCAYTPDDIILDIIRQYEDDEIHYLAKHNRIHVDAILQKQEDERIKRIQSQKKA